MASDAQYRFLPWARRGLAGAVQQADNGGSLPGRGRVSVGITISNVDPAGVDLSLYGPGDVHGIDPRLIVRTSPPRRATNVEPNYLAAIEFDPPDFVWMFTPARAGNRQRLRPWLVLIVLDRSIVGTPRADRSKPLPTISIGAEDSGGELPDLSESWAWAHTQLVSDSPAGALTAELSTHPDLNVSRLLCPRRLQPNKQYVACLVPAFSSGVARGLGGTPDPAAPLTPAWQSPSPGSVTLPVYYHWTFATGPLGDFESLARRLKPFKSPQSVGRIPMYIGDGAPELPLLPPDDAEATVMMDGVLRSPKQQSGTLADIPDVIEDGLRAAVNTPVTQLAEGPSDATPPLAPPLYGQWHARQHSLQSGGSGWLHELNVDPRARVAAGLGADVVRKYQEEFMQLCWEQVGEVLKANERLNWGRLAFEAERHVYERHYKPLPNDRLLQLTQRLHQRTLHVNRTIENQIDRSSMPHALVDSSFRRSTSPQRPLIQRTIRRLSLGNRLANVAATRMGSTLVTRMAAGTTEADPTRFTPDGLKGSTILDAVAKGAISEIAGIAVERSEARNIAKQVQQFSGSDFQQQPLQFALRENLRTTGLVTVRQVDNFRLLSETTPEQRPLNIHGALRNLLEFSVKNPQAPAVLIDLEKDNAPIFRPIDIDARGNILIGASAANPGSSAGAIDVNSLPANVSVGSVFSALPPGSFSSVANNSINISVDRGGSMLVRDNVRGSAANVVLTGRGSGVGSTIGGSTFTPIAGPITGPVTGPVTGPIIRPDVTAPVTPPNNTIPLPIKEVDSIVRFEGLLAQTLRDQRFSEPALIGRVQPFNLNAVGASLLASIDPVVMVPRRLREMINLDKGDLWATAAGDRLLTLVETFDRILAAPEITMPMYSFLAELSQERFCPGIGIIPADSITLLETNPRFIEAFMVGVNYEMNRELRWRAYPGDERATPMRFFWDWTDDQPDIGPIHLWRRNIKLGNNSRGAGSGGQIVLLVRGELLRRYPNLVMMAWKAKTNVEELIDPPGPKDVLQPVFQGKLQPDIAFAGFDLTDSQLLNNGGYFFIVAEQPTEPRFGLDEDEVSGPPTLWSMASWAHTDVVPGAHLQLTKAGMLSNRQIAGLRFGENSAHMASILLQQPMRVAVHARHIVDL